METTALTLPCPAKLNLFLHILGQREDGYHNLQTVFQLLDIGDTLTITPTEDSSFSIAPNLPGLAAEDNLVYKAARALQQYSNVNKGAALHLEKVLPMGGGTGGGSSNAATTLVGLNYLWGTNLTIDQLATIGQKLGADVPVFIRGHSAWAEGVGEALTPIELATRWYVVVAPQCHVSTAAIFSHKDLTRDTLAITVAAFLERGGKNDCQPLVEVLFPQVRDAVEWLNQFGLAQLTGTGACVFAPFDSKEAAQAVLAKLPGSMQGFVAKGVNQSPLHQCLPRK